MNTKTVNTGGRSLDGADVETFERVDGKMTLHGRPRPAKGPSSLENIFDRNESPENR